MSVRLSTDAERKAALERIAAERAEHMACPDPNCRAVMEWVATLESDDEGRFQSHLVQCPKCKTIATRDRL